MLCTVVWLRVARCCALWCGYVWLDVVHCGVATCGSMLCTVVWLDVVHCDVATYTSTITAFVLTRWKLFLTDASDTLSGGGRGQLVHAPDCTFVSPANLQEPSPPSAALPGWHRSHR